MEANEFVKKHGLDKALEVVNRDDCIYAIAVCMYEDRLSYSVSMAYGFTLISDLKRLVESHEYIENFGGLEKAKMRCYPAKHLTMESYHKLKQVISDVESCE